MALTNELLTNNPTTAALTPEVMAAIVEMSQNDENTVIAKKTGEIYGGLDADILASSGIAKEGAERTYDYAKRVIGQFKQQAGDSAGLTKQITDLTKEKARLEKVIADGGADAETRNALKKAHADLANVTKEYADLKTQFDTEKADHEKALFGMRLDSEFARATAGIKFKADLPAAVTSVILEQAIQKVKGMSPEYIDDGQGGKVLAFMENGTPRRNPENNLRPFTATELVTKELSAMGVLEAGRVQTGTGTTPTIPTPTGAPVSADISGARSQSEAYEVIAKTLMGQGKIKGSKEFETAMAAAWKENFDVIKKLPATL